MTNKNQKNGGAGIGTGALITGAALAAGYYFYMNEDAKKHRKVAAEWATEMKDQVIDKALKLKEVTEETLMPIIDEVSNIYHGAGNIESGDLKSAVQELKDNWSKVAEEIKSASKNSVGTVKRSVRKKRGSSGNSKS